MKLAISGKGGVGKTTIAAALIKSFARTHHTVYAVDADPDASLAAALGIPEEVARGLKPVVEMKEIIREKMGDGTFFTLNPRVDDVLDNYSYRHRNIRFLRMGGIKRGGTECYCRENTFLAALISSLLLDRDELVVMDMGAGIEHLSRGTARGVDLMLVVVEPSRLSINTAYLVTELAADLGIQKVRVVGNKVRTPKEREFILNSFPAERLLGIIPFSNHILEASQEKGEVPEEDIENVLDEIREKIEKEAGGVPS
ncbi:AAA family ATPase [Desulfovirgula thermocuniculi]|uniref:ATP-binding protein n=1 Tax=Desulfovirgula thermocuniculi TaxID=348842 RepID=UPI000408CDD1|nr:AAA family ATPase [Desulfovirgula thermocuniculi]